MSILKAFAEAAPASAVGDPAMARFTAMLGHAVEELEPDAPHPAAKAQANRSPEAPAETVNIPLPPSVPASQPVIPSVESLPTLDNAAFESEPHLPAAPSGSESQVTQPPPIAVAHTKEGPAARTTAPAPVFPVPPEPRSAFPLAAAGTAGRQSAAETTAALPSALPLAASHSTINPLSAGAPGSPASPAPVPALSDSRGETQASNSATPQTPPVLAAPVTCPGQKPPTASAVTPPDFEPRWSPVKSDSARLTEITDAASAAAHAAPEVLPFPGKPVTVVASAKPSIVPAAANADGVPAASAASIPLQVRTPAVARPAKPKVLSAARPVKSGAPLAGATQLGSARIQPPAGAPATPQQKSAPYMRHEATITYPEMLPKATSAGDNPVSAVPLTMLSATMLCAVPTENSTQASAPTAGPSARPFAPPAASAAGTHIEEDAAATCAAEPCTTQPVLSGGASQQISTGNPDQAELAFAGRLSPTSTAPAAAPANSSAAESLRQPLTIEDPTPRLPTASAADRRPAAAAAPSSGASEPTSQVSATDDEEPVAEDAPAPIAPAAFDSRRKSDAATGMNGSSDARPALPSASVANAEPATPVVPEPQNGSSFAAAPHSALTNDRPESQPQAERAIPNRRVGVAATPDSAAAAVPAAAQTSGVVLQSGPISAAPRTAAMDTVADPPPVHQPATVETAPADAPKPASAAREIKLQLNGGEQRVEVRMVERGGDVHVDVRTSDTRLAGSLREDLPALSARLEQSGFHAENWHTGAPAQAQRTGMTETSPGSTTQDQQGRSGQNGSQQEGREQSPKQPSSPQRKEERKDFAWLFTSLR